MKYANTAASHSPPYATTKGPCESIRRQVAVFGLQMLTSMTVNENSQKTYDLRWILGTFCAFVRVTTKFSPIIIIIIIFKILNKHLSIFIYIPSRSFSFLLVFFLTHLSPPNKQGWACPCRKTKVSREERFGTDNKVFVILYFAYVFFQTFEMILRRFIAFSCFSFRFYEVNNVNKFQFSRAVHKGEVNKENEFSVRRFSMQLILLVG